MNAGRELATEEIREQKATIAAMSARIAALEAELAKERDILRRTGNFLRATDWSSEDSKRISRGRLLDDIDAIFSQEPPNAK